MCAFFCSFSINKFILYYFISQGTVWHHRLLTRWLARAVLLLYVFLAVMNVIKPLSWSSTSLFFAEFRILQITVVEA